MGTIRTGAMLLEKIAIPGNCPGNLPNVVRVGTDMGGAAGYDAFRHHILTNVEAASLDTKFDDGDLANGRMYFNAYGFNNGAYTRTYYRCY